MLPKNYEKIIALERAFNHELAIAADEKLLQKTPDAIDIRIARRKMEMKKFGSYTRPGLWDNDLDKYQEDDYIYPSKVDGYQIKLSRNGGLGWNGYVILPKSHDAIGISLFDLNLDCNFDLTFSKNNVFGFDHMNSHDVHPRPF